MDPIQRILCPVDFSQPSLAALDYAKGFARAVGADLFLINAFATPASYDLAGQRMPADPTIMSQLEGLQADADGVKITCIGHAGIPDEVICWAAEHNDCQLIIMGTHGRTGLKHLLFGSTAEAVLRHARCPVMAIREQKEHAKKLDEPTVMPLPAPRYM
ncbi:MAG: universal stress protein [Planctomycetota bacterium]